VAKLINRVVEYLPEFQCNFVVGYFDGVPTPREVADAYFEGNVPDNWYEYPEVAATEGRLTTYPQRVSSLWRVLLGEDC
jgi:hypothetical protein